jgi:hypothetical protein
MVQLCVALWFLVACKIGEIQLTGPGNGSQRIAEVHVSGRQALVIGETTTLSASAYSRECDIEFCYTRPVNATFAWHTSDGRVADVSHGHVRAIGRGVAYIVAEAGGVRDSVRIRVGIRYIPLAVMAPGGRCALTEAGAAYCWNLPFNSPDANLGWGAPRLVAGGLSFSALSGGSAFACGIGTGALGYCWGNAYSLGNGQPDPGGNPVLVAGGLTFRSISAASRMRDALPPLAPMPEPNPYTHACGVAAAGAAYCWGVNDRGQLGTDSGLVTCEPGTCSPTPVPVAGGLAFTAIRAGGTHTCALTADGQAYCWGDNTWGQLGDSAGGFRSTPAAVGSVAPLIALAAGVDHTCGLAGDGTAWCWGRNHEGQLGSGSTDTLPHPTATPAFGNRSFTSIDAGRGTCALTATSQVYCWGLVTAGPAVVTEGPPFRSIGVDAEGGGFAIGTDLRVYAFGLWNRIARPVGGPIEF